MQISSFNAATPARPQGLPQARTSVETAPQQDLIDIGNSNKEMFDSREMGKMLFACVGGIVGAGVGGTVGGIAGASAWGLGGGIGMAVAGVAIGGAAGLYIGYHKG